MKSSSPSYSLWVSPWDDPYLNLALESYLFEKVLTKDCPYLLFFYRNRPSVVIGRFQNPWKECNLSLMKQHCVALVRRESGGGAVYHDHDNLNFCFMALSEFYNPSFHHELLCAALDPYFRPLGFTLLQDDHGSYFFQDQKNNQVYKISGSAFKVKKDRKYHHGTLLAKAHPLLQEFLKSPWSFSHSLSTPSRPKQTLGILDLTQRGQSELSSAIFFKEELERIQEGLGDRLVKRRLFHDYDLERGWIQNKQKNFQSRSWIYAQTPKAIGTFNEVDEKIEGEWEKEWVKIKKGTDSKSLNLVTSSDFEFDSFFLF